VPIAKSCDFNILILHLAAKVYEHPSFHQYLELQISIFQNVNQVTVVLWTQIRMVTLNRFGTVGIHLMGGGQLRKI